MGHRKVKKDQLTSRLMLSDKTGGRVARAVASEGAVHTLKMGWGQSGDKEAGSAVKPVITQKTSHCLLYFFTVKTVLVLKQSKVNTRVLFSTACLGDVYRFPISKSFLWRQLLQSRLLPSQG